MDRLHNALPTPRFNVSRSHIFFAGVLLGVLSCVSVASASNNQYFAPLDNKGVECLQGIDWTTDASVSPDYPTTVLVNYKSFDRFMQCALPDENSRAEALITRSIRVIQDKGTGNWVQWIRGSREKRPIEVAVNGLIVQRASYFMGAKHHTPPETALLNGLTYQRVPSFPGFCDDLKGRGDLKAYKWCTGELSPSEAQDLRLTSCKDQHCRKSASSLADRP